MNVNPETIRSKVESKMRQAGWALTVRGILAVVFGILALRSPGTTVAALVVIFAIYAFADGVLDFVLAARLGRAGESWGWYLFEGIVSVVLGFVALAYPGVTLMAIILLIGLRAILLGVIELVGAFAWKGFESRWLLGIAGALSLMLGIMLLASPVAGGYALLWTIGVYALVVGVMLFALGLRVLGAERRIERLHEPPPAIP